MQVNRHNSIGNILDNTIVINDTNPLTSPNSLMNMAQYTKRLGKFTIPSTINHIALFSSFSYPQ